jgi:hypothetical protein
VHARQVRVAGGKSAAEYPTTAPTRGTRRRAGASAGDLIRQYQARPGTDRHLEPETVAAVRLTASGGLVVAAISVLGTLE